MNRLAVLLPVLLGAQLAFGQEATFETAEEFDAAKILPAELLQGPHHRVAARVRSDGYLNYYSIESDFGEFEAVSTAMLKTRVGEINALAELNELSKTEVFAKAAAEAGVDVAQELVGSEEEGTDSASTDDESMTDDESTTEKAVGLTEGYLGVDKAQRAWARKLGTDPYSTNAVLQGVIKEVAWAERLGKFGMGFAGVPKIPGADIISDVNEAVWSKDPYELKDLNRARLDATGASEELIEIYLDNRRLTPSQQTLLTAAIAELEDVGGRDGILRQSLQLDGEPEINFFIKSVILLAWYHRNQEPVVAVDTSGAIPAGLLEEGTMALTFATDHVYWTEAIAQAAERYGAQAPEGLEVWFLGSTSERSAAALEQSGFRVHTNVTELLEPGGD